MAKRTRSATYLHVTAIDNGFDMVHRMALSLAKGKRGDGYNVVKVTHDMNKVSLLNYPDFDTAETPHLESSVCINLEERTVRSMRFGRKAPAPILHRKELLL